MGAPMFCIKVWDGPITGGITVYSPPELNATLGQADKFFVQARGSQPSGTPSLKVDMERSNDNLNWNTLSSPVTTTALTANAVTHMYGQDTGTNIGGCFARAAITMTGGTPSAHVEVWVTGREA